MVSVLDEKKRPVVLVVSEAGASVYSASQSAIDEFPELDVTVRGAISIGRRLMDPLAELVKIDPKSIGVGQYQHDVDQKFLKNKLGEIVESCVNYVGVDLNSALRGTVVICFWNKTEDCGEYCDGCGTKKGLLLRETIYLMLQAWERRHFYNQPDSCA